MVNHVGAIPVKFVVTQSDADVSQPRKDAQRLAGRLLRAAAHSMQSGHDSTLTLHIPAHPVDAAITGASLLIIAQQIDPLPTPHVTNKKESN